MLKYFIILTLFILSSFVAAQAFASNLDKIAQEISDTSMSPFCPGRTISACPSGDAKNLRDKIKSWLEQGYSEQAVRNQLSMVYGKEVSGKPEFQGLGILAWIIPACFVLLGIFLITRKVDKPQELGEASFDNDIQLELEKRLSR